MLFLDKPLLSHCHRQQRPTKNRHVQGMLDETDPLMNIKLCALRFDVSGPSEASGGLGGFGPPIVCGSLLILKVKKAVKAKVVGTKIQTRIYWRKLPESIKNPMSFDVIQVEIFKIFREGLLLIVILCFRKWHIFQKWGVFQRSKGRCHEKFPRRQAPGPPILLASLAPLFSPFPT